MQDLPLDIHSRKYEARVAFCVHRMKGTLRCLADRLTNERSSFFSSAFLRPRRVLLALAGSASGSSALTIHDLVHDHAMYDSRHDTHDAGQGQHQQQLLPASAAPSQPWYPGAIGSIPRAGPPAHYLPRHSRYESTDSSIYESSWFSDSPSILSPTSPEAGYYSAGDASDFSANPGIWSPRSSIGYPMSGPVFRPQASLTLDPSRLSALHLSSTASQAPPPAAAEKEETEEDAVGEVEEMSGDDSEYVESKRVAPRKKGKRLMKLEDDTPEIESVSYEQMERLSEDC